jgi:hypothetical protein
LERKRRGDSISPSFPRFGSFGLHLLGCSRRYLNELHDLIVRAADYITNEMFPSTWREIEYGLDVGRTNNGAHMEIY